MENPGKFDRYVSFQVPTTTRTGMGAPVKSFVHSFYQWCSRDEVGQGNETYINERLVLPYRFRYRTHYRSDIDETMQIADDSVNYNILSVMPTEGRMFIEILAEKITE